MVLVRPASFEDHPVVLHRCSFIEPGPKSLGGDFPVGSKDSTADGTTLSQRKLRRFHPPLMQRLVDNSQMNAKAPNRLTYAYQPACQNCTARPQGATPPRQAELAEHGEPTRHQPGTHQAHLRLPANPPNLHGTKRDPGAGRRTGVSLGLPGRSAYLRLGLFQRIGPRCVPAITLARMSLLLGRFGSFLVGPPPRNNDRRFRSSLAMGTPLALRSTML
jgi:hypothetical protein